MKIVPKRNVLSARSNATSAPDRQTRSNPPANTDSYTPHNTASLCAVYTSYAEPTDAITASFIPRYVTYSGVSVFF